MKWGKIDTIVVKAYVFTLKDLHYVYHLHHHHHHNWSWQVILIGTKKYEILIINPHAIHNNGSGSLTMLFGILISVCLQSAQTSQCNYHLAASDGTSRQLLEPRHYTIHTDRYQGILGSPCLKKMQMTKIGEDFEYVTVMLSIPSHAVFPTALHSASETESLSSGAFHAHQYYRNACMDGKQA